MNKIKKSILSIFLVLSLITSGFIGLILFNGLFDTGSVYGANIIVDTNGNGDFASIQEAIDAAVAADTIKVWGGIYNENIVISKSINLIGNDSTNTVIIGDGTTTVIQILSDRVNIRGFNITSERFVTAGISLTGVNNCSIFDNNYFDLLNGIVMDNSDSNIIGSNTMVSCGIDIFGNKLSNWNTHIIYDNNTVNGKLVYYWKDTITGTIPANAGQVILANCQNINIEDQDLSNGSLGIELGFSNNNKIRNNSCNDNNKFGVYLYSSGQNIIENNTCNFNQWDAIELISSDQNTIANNTCSNNNDGINLYLSNSNDIINNTCNSNNYDGIWVAESNSNYIFNNTFNQNNDDGIDIFESISTTIDDNICNLNEDYGIVIQNAFFSKISNNQMESCGLHLVGYLMPHYDSHEIYDNNLVNGKNLYYWKNKTSGQIPAGAGQVILVNCVNVIIKDQNLSDGSNSIELFFSDNNEIKNNLCNQNNNNGMYLWRSDDNLIDNNRFNQSFYHGILLSESHLNEITNNICNLNLNQGIYLKYSRTNEISNNICNYNNVTGLLARNSKYNNINNNTCNSNVYYGMYLDESISNYIINNTCNSNAYDGIWLGESDSNDIIDNLCNFNDNCGLNLEISDSNTIKSNLFDSNTKYGILIYKSNSNSIFDNTCVNNDYGTIISHSRLNDVYKNNQSSNKIVGIKLDNAELNYIINNTCDLNPSVGIELLRSDWNVIENNTCILTDVGIYIYLSYSNAISNNTCKLNDFYGIYLKESSSNKLLNNICILSTNYGIFLSHASINIVEQNDCSTNGKGIFLYYGSFNNEFIQNIISSNTHTGIAIKAGCKDNSFFHNNIVDNALQADVETIGSNYWDNGNGEGNYWSDYFGLDNGAYGRIPNDGIGDTRLPHLSLDNYPFKNYSGWRYPGQPILEANALIDADGNYFLFWNETRGTIGYILEEATNNVFNSPIILNDGWIQKDTVLIFNVTGKPEGTYYYHLKAVNEQSESDWSNTIAIIVDHPPMIPQNFNVSVYPGGNALNMSWDLNIIDTDAYELYFKNNTNPDWTYLDNIIQPLNIFNHTNLTDDEIYYYKIRAKNSIGIYSNFSTIVSATPKDTMPPRVPIGLHIVNITNNSIEISWKANTDPDLVGYNIYKSSIPNPDDWGDPIDTTLKGNEKYTDIVFDKIAKYYYVITAFDEVPNESNYSKIAFGTIMSGPFSPEIYNPVSDFEIIEDAIDNTTINLFSWFIDFDYDPLKFRCEGQEHINVTIYQAIGTVVLRPEQDWNGREILTFYVNDSISEISDNVSITVSGVNDPPGPLIILTPNNGDIFEKGALLSFAAMCSDPDLPYGDKLTINWSSNISGLLGVGDILVNVSLPAGEHQIILGVTDINGTTSVTSVNITVLDDTSDDGPDKAPNNLALIIVVASIIIIIVLIILLFIFPGWVTLKKIIFREKGSDEQSDENETTDEDVKQTDIKTMITKSKSTTLDEKEPEPKKTPSKSKKTTSIEKDPEQKKTPKKSNILSSKMTEKRSKKSN